MYLETVNVTDWYNMIDSKCLSGSKDQLWGRVAQIGQPSLWEVLDISITLW